jgi:Zn-dependent protease
MFVDLTVNLIVLRLVSLLIIAPVQRVAVAATAVALGDRGPKYDGELTADPLRHLDLFGTISTIVFGIGWSKPVTVDPAELRMGRAGIVVVIIAAFAALLATAFVLRVLVIPALTMLPYTAGLTALSFLQVAARVALWFALLGLVPIPPLTGSLLLTAFGIRVSRQVQWILAAGLSLAVATGVVGRLLGPAHAVLTSLVLGE